MYSEEERIEQMSKTRIPSGYLCEGERPDDAIRRIVRDQINAKRFSVSGPKVFSYNSKSDWYPGNYHWDLVFVYEVVIEEPIKKARWWRSLEFLGQEELRKKDFGWNADLMQDLRLLPHSG